MTQLAPVLRNLDLPPARAIDQFCARYPIRRLSIFGSALRDDFDDNSDLDVLVEFEPAAQVGLMTMARMTRELEQLTGRKVDLLTPEFLSPHFRQQVIDNAVVWYEKAA
jgi:predicted nucleotidyltransferase